MPKGQVTPQPPSNTSSRRANDGVSRYPSYQKIFQPAENFQNIYRTLWKLGEFSFNFLSVLQYFLWNYSDYAIFSHIFAKVR